MVSEQLVSGCSRREAKLEAKSNKSTGSAHTTQEEGYSICPGQGKADGCSDRLLTANHPYANNEVWGLECTKEDQLRNSATSMQVHTGSPVRTATYQTGETRSWITSSVIGKHWQPPAELKWGSWTNGQRVWVELLGEAGRSNYSLLDPSEHWQVSCLQLQHETILL